MNRDDDFIDQLEDYLATYEGVVPLPASVRDAVSASLPDTRQVRGPRGPERMRTMVTQLSAPARWGIGIAAALVVFVGAGALIPRAAAPGIGAIPTPTASPDVNPSPSSAASPPAVTGPTPLSAERGGTPCGEDLGVYFETSCMPAGRYRLSSEEWPATITFEASTGWWPYLVGNQAEGIIGPRGALEPRGSGWGLIFLRVGEVSQDPCDAAAGRLPASETASVDGLIAAMRSWPNFAVSDAQPIVVDGYQGKLVTVTSTQTKSDCAVHSIWATPGGTEIDAYPMVVDTGAPQPGTFRILDVGGTLVVVRTTAFGDPTPHELDERAQPDPTHHAVSDRVDMQSMLDSIHIGS